ncbi:MAG: CAP domain-containing protein [Gemmatimonadetes bacterium]|nr:CAP domain-containing protein [Gemmatimonadota bacterium]
MMLMASCGTETPVTSPPRTDSGLPPKPAPIDTTAVLEDPVIAQGEDRDGVNPGTIAPGGPDAMLRVAMSERLRIAIEGLRHLPGMCVGTGRMHHAPASAEEDTLASRQDLYKAAADHAVDMLEEHYFSHNGLDGSWPQNRAWAAGYRGTIVGENLATVIFPRGYRFTETQVLEIFVNRWLASESGHCDTIYNMNWEDTGVAVASKIGGKGKTRFVGVQMFGAWN